MVPLTNSTTAAAATAGALTDFGTLDISHRHQLSHFAIDIEIVVLDRDGS